MRKGKIKQALQLALEDYDRYTILEITENKEKGWANGTEILNEASLKEVAKALDKMEIR